MLDKNESFQPPTESEEWTDHQFGIVLNYLSQYDVPSDGRILLQWLAVPYISIWNGVCTDPKVGSTVWIMHNQLQTDHFTGDSNIPLREVLRIFADRWIKAGRDLQKNPDARLLAHPDEYPEPAEYAKQLVKYGEMFQNVADDEDLEF